MKYPETELHALAARVAKLEAQNGKWKLASLLLALASSSLVLMAARPADHIDPNVIHARTVEAQDFVLKDDDGQVHARLTLNPAIKRQLNGGRVQIMNPAFGPALQFYDDKGNAIWTAPQEPAMIPAR
ncbi:MAG TPA: hypothetical protein VH110_09015 [Candidatus Acidoferrum sp.]|jgi:hypothetical protein|nr:hypothetical protein [Candidatus Acidoferrum sp.]